MALISDSLCSTIEGSSLQRLLSGPWTSGDEGMSTDSAGRVARSDLKEMWPLSTGWSKQLWRRWDDVTSEGLGGSFGGGGDEGTALATRGG